ncbi:MAG TPA: hypothetical protein VFM70_03505 [Salinimicrobium sp.]|nr:hypothetical protein [Salinimicrobium sp.]
MNFLQRLGYYLGGFAVGLVILAYFFNGKKASCNYGPGAKVIQDINYKEQVYSEKALSFIEENQIDSTSINRVLQYGDVDFSQSQTDLDSCNIYVIQGENNPFLQITLENCKELVTILEIEKIASKD